MPPGERHPPIIGGNTSCFVHVHLSVNVAPITHHSLSLDDPPPGLDGEEEAHPFASEGDTFQHYQVLRRADGSLWELGRGAMGVTYKAFDTNLRCHVALKVISAHYLHSDMAGQRFIREARIAARVRHPNIAAVYHLGTDPQGFFYSMEFIDGETLETLVERVGPLPLETVLRIGLQVARALAAASRLGLIHRDIKPANLMVLHQDEDGEDRLLVKMIDFGLARSYAGDDSHPQLTATGFVGTPLYASPEQLEERDLDVRSDIYSLGVTLWILLTGQPPFAGKMTQVITQHLHAPPPWWQLGECGEAVRALLERMLHKNRLERFQTANDLRLAIEGCLRCVTGKDISPAEGADLAEPAPRPVAVATGANPAATAADDVPVSQLLGTIVSRLGTAAKSHASASLATLRLPSRVAGENNSSGSRKLTHLRSPLVGVVIVALCICGLVYWHSLTGTVDAAHPASTPSSPKVVPVLAAASVPPVVASAESTPPHEIKTESAATEPSSPVMSQPLETPVADTITSDPRPHEPAAKPVENALSGPDGLAGLDGSPSNTQESAASPTPAANDEHDKAQDASSNTPAKGLSGTTHNTHTHHGSRPAPTPTPGFFQKLFGIKPKPKLK